LTWLSCCISGHQCSRNRSHFVRCQQPAIATSGQAWTHLGQHPTAVSPAVSWNCSGHPVVPPAVAEHAVAYPAGHSIPGEYTPHPPKLAGGAGAPVDVAGQQVAASAGRPALQLWPRKAKLPAPSPKTPPSSWPTATVHAGGGVKMVVRGPKIVGTWPTRAVADMPQSGVNECDVWFDEGEKESRNETKRESCVHICWRRSRAIASYHEITTGQELEISLNIHLGQECSFPRKREGMRPLFTRP